MICTAGANGYICFWNARANKTQQQLRYNQDQQTSHLQVARRLPHINASPTTSAVTPFPNMTVNTGNNHNQAIILVVSESSYTPRPSIQLSATPTPSMQPTPTTSQSLPSSHDTFDTTLAKRSLPPKTPRPTEDRKSVELGELPGHRDMCVVLIVGLLSFSPLFSLLLRPACVHVCTNETHNHILLSDIDRGGGMQVVLSRYDASWYAGALVCVRCV